MNLPKQVWAKMPEGTLKYQAARYLEDHTVEEAIKRFSDSAIGSQIPGRSAEAAAVVGALELMRQKRPRKDRSPTGVVVKVHLNTTATLYQKLAKAERARK